MQTIRIPPGDVDTAPDVWRFFDTASGRMCRVIIRVAPHHRHNLFGVTPTVEWSHEYDLTGVPQWGLIAPDADANARAIAGALFLAMRGVPSETFPGYASSHYVQAAPATPEAVKATLAHIRKPPRRRRGR